MPFITIIIATLNAEKTLADCLLSIIQQSLFDRIEILVKDAESTDGTISILKSYERYISYWVSSPDSGIYNAWNQILPKASGKWILFLGADDKLYNDQVISKSFSILNNIHPSIGIAYGNVRLVNQNNETLFDLGKNLDKTIKCIKQKMCIPHQGIFHKKVLFDEYGHFSTNYKISSDYEFIRRVATDNNVYNLNIIVSYMRTGGISSESRFTFLRLKEILQINRLYGSRLPGRLWLITFINTCFRHSLFLLIGQKNGRYLLDRLRVIAGLPLYWTKI